MLITEFEKYYELCEKFYQMLNWDKKSIRFKLQNNGLCFQHINSTITLFIDSTVKNKILNIHTRKTSNGEWVSIFSYKKHPNYMDNFGKQRPSKDRLFNLNLETDLPFTFEELEFIEELMDKFETPIKVEITVYQIQK